jgi:phospholipase/carboxylesterase
MMISFAYFLLSIALLVICITDLKKGIIPDSLLIIIALLGVLRFGTAHTISMVILGLMSYGLAKIYPLIRKEEWLGWGDVKLMTVSGLWLTPSQIPLFLMLGGAAGIMLALLWRALKKGNRFPLGPALALSLGICIVGNDKLSGEEKKMTTSFIDYRLPPASGSKPDSIVVLLHGYGSNGQDLLSLGHIWSSRFPNTLFVAPDGPDESVLYPPGNQWFGLEDWDPSIKLTEEQIARMVRDIQVLAPSFNRYLDQLLVDYGLPPEKLALVGFSQGAMVALHLGLHRPQCAAVVAYSGAFLDDPQQTKVARPPVLVVQGLDDHVVPPQLAQLAEEHLKALGIPVTLVLLPHLEHSIDNRGLEMGGVFLQENLYKE